MRVVVGAILVSLVILLDELGNDDASGEGIDIESGIAEYCRAVIAGIAGSLKFML